MCEIETKIVLIYFSEPEPEVSKEPHNTGIYHEWPVGRPGRPTWQHNTATPIYAQLNLLHLTS